MDTQLQLRRIDPNEVVVGRTLPGHLRDANGRILIPAGRVVTPRHVAALAGRQSTALFAGPDWSEPAPQVTPTETVDAQELAAALRARGSRRGPLKTRRHKRFRWNAQLEVLLEERGMDGCRRRKLTVRTCDLSVGGLSFYHDQYIHPMTIVHARVDGRPVRAPLRAVVRSCVLISGHGHRVGAEFVHDEQPGEAEAGE